MTPLEIREQVLYNIFGEATPPTSAITRATTYLKEVMREIEDMGQWWWSRRVVGGLVQLSTVVTDASVRVVAGELAELTALVKSQQLLAVEKLLVWDVGQNVTLAGVDIAAVNAKGLELSRADVNSQLVAQIAMRTFSPDLTGAVLAGAEIKYSEPGDPRCYFFGSDIMNLQGTFFNQRVFVYPIPEDKTMYTAEVSVRTDLDFDFTTTEEESAAVAEAQNINDRIGLALVAGGTARLAGALAHTDIMQRFMAEYGTQLNRMRMDNARMLSNNLMECEYNDI